MSLSEYNPELVHDQSVLRRSASEKPTKILAKTDNIIAKGLQLEWSPESISRRKIAENIPLSERLSHTKIYRRVAYDKHRGGQLYRDFPRFGKHSGKG